MSQPVVNQQCSGSKGNEESLEKVGRREDGKSKGDEAVSPHADLDPMHEDRETGGGFDFEVGDTLHVNLGNKYVAAQEVGPEEVDKVEFNRGVFSEMGYTLGVGRVDSDVPSDTGFKVGNRNLRRTGFKKPKIMAQSRKDKGRCFTPTESRPKKRSIHQLDEEFLLSPPPQCPGSDPVDAQIPAASNLQTPVLDLNRSVGEGLSSETVVKDSLESEGNTTKRR
ncbi:hypothetical protein Hanom_Chr10g00874001 [Helianthus anomalus]